MNATHVLVCVTGQRTCERLIRAGAELTGGAEGALSVLHVARTGQRFLDGDDEAAALDYLFQASTGYGANMTLTHSGDVHGAIADFARKYGAEIVILGMTRDTGKGIALAARLRTALPGVEIREIITSGE